jgi:ferredoxin
MKDFLRIFNLRTISFLVAVILALPISWKGLTGFYLWLSPFIMLSSISSLKSFVLLNGLGFLILTFALFRKRWFCNNLCPVGWSCDKVSGLSNKAFTYKLVPDFGKWMAIISLAASIIGVPLFVIFDPLAIFNGFFSIFSGRFEHFEIIFYTVFPLLLVIHLVFPGIWCKKICPLGGLQIAADDMKNVIKNYFDKTDKDTLTFNQGRRYFLMSGVGIATGLTVPRILKPPEKAVIRPPAAVDHGLFNFLCCRCGNCAKSCPTGIIEPLTSTANPISWMTPVLRFTSGYCLETCNLCSQVCPTGAITLFSAEAKKELFIGSAEADLENCLLVNKKECVKCKESCKYGAIEFIASGNILNTVPVIDIKICVGCGACAVVCPPECIKIKPINF